MTWLLILSEYQQEGYQPSLWWGLARDGADGGIQHHATVVLANVAVTLLEADLLQAGYPADGDLGTVAVVGFFRACRRSRPARQSRKALASA